MLLTIPEETVKRLFVYYRALLESRQKDVISSEELSKLTGCTAAQIRKDLTYFGQFGIPGKGYEIEWLRHQIKSILGIDRQWDVVLIGIGNLGRALLAYPGFKVEGFRITRIFDNDADKVGKTCAGLKIQHIKDLKEWVEGNPVKMAVVAVPAKAAQEVTSLLADAGIKAILNFAPASVFAPPDVKILNIDITNELARLSYYLTKPLLQFSQPDQKEVI